MHNNTPRKTDQERNTLRFDGQPIRRLGHMAQKAARFKSKKAYDRKKSWKDD